MNKKKIESKFKISLADMVMACAALTVVAGLSIKLGRQIERHRMASSCNTDVMKRLCNAVMRSSGVVVTNGTGNLYGALEYLIDKRGISLYDDISGLAIFMSEKSKR